MAIKFTADQEKAINEKGNILVAAAAGSGKTAVLVERVIRNIIEKGMNIDEMLALTFTKAAASEMKEKIIDAIYKRMEEESSVHLSKQLLLINNANISTIHSFCFNIIKEHFYILGISPNVKVGTNEELEVLKMESLDEAFEFFYNLEENAKDFEEYIFKFSGYRNDDNIKSLILDIYNFLNTIPFYEDFVVRFKSFLENPNFFDSNIFLEYFKNLKQNIFEKLSILKEVLVELKKEMQVISEKEAEKIGKNVNVLKEDINFLEKIYDEEDWNNICEIFLSPGFTKTWPSNTTKNEIVDKAKNIRDGVKDYVKELSSNIFSKTKEDVLDENKNFLKFLNTSLDIVNKFNEIYEGKKQEEEILDFSDLEKLSLKILVRKKEEDEEVEEKNIISLPYVKTDIAINLSERFKEIQIDEYQDINTMQEYILNSVSSVNVFQVGDIKQSIYMFRNANPNLFLSKYLKYVDAFKLDESLNEEENGKKNNKKIKLFKNFRSRSEILNYTNNIFSVLMSKDLGSIDYTEEEYLNPGMNYEDKNEIEKYIPELVYIETKGDLDLEDLSKEEKEQIEDLNKMEHEALYIKNKIEEIIRSEFKIFDKSTGTYRNAEYRDIVILLRTSENKAGVIEKVLADANIPVYTEESKGYLDSVEANKVTSYLKIIDNPSDDIELLTVLRSYFWKLTLNDILEFVLDANKVLKENGKNINISIYEKMKVYVESDFENIILKEKIKEFLENLKNLKEEVKIQGIASLVKKIISDSGYLDYVLFRPNGNIKRANLELFMIKSVEYEKNGLSSLKRFINYLEKISENLKDQESAQLISENENVVRIMTIHKSKGLEFPIVFLANADKKVNKMDFNKEILFDDKLGFAGDYIDGDLKIKYPTLLKQIFIQKKMTDLISEELRILYVALTRAREKIYIVGAVDEYRKYMEKLKNNGSKHLNYPNLSKEYIKENNSYLNFLSMVSLYEKEKGVRLELKEQIYNLDNLGFEAKNIEKEINEEIKNKIQKIEETNDEKYIENSDLNYIEKIFEDENENEEKEINENKIKNKLKNTNLEKFSRKMSVSKIIQNEERQINYERPKIMQKESGLSGKEKGDIIHNIFKNMDFNTKWNEEKIKTYLDMEKAFPLKYNEEEKEIIKEDIFKGFFESNIYERILNAKEIQKEENFYFLIEESELKKFIKNEDEINKEKNKEEDKILVQGIMDLYFIEQNGNIVLIDYKTDKPKNIKELKNQLIKNYSKQLKLYSLILEKKYNKKVDEIYIYSTTLKEFIEIK